MNKQHLIDEVAEMTGLKKSEAKKAVDAVTMVIQSSLEKDDKVAIAGFGTFSVHDRKARMGINPKTRESIKIPACKVAKFKPAKSLKEAVNK